MRLHRLKITAFGPYPDTQEIDFDSLCEAGLFLIHGATGAGKTSVLDAVCFALYGRVPSVRDAAKSLRSDHASPDQRPEVVLEVTIRGRRLRISRSPAWARPKLRGTGFTEEKAKALVEEQVATGEWIGRATRLDEAGLLIGNLLGMSADQFFQVVLLPQGDFARFLRATAEERRKVLEKLFATEVFTQVEKWLGDRGLDSRHRVDDAIRVAVEVADRAAEAAAVSDRPDLEPDGLAGWIVEVGAELADLLTATEGLAGEAELALAGARTADAHGRAVADLRRRHAEAAARGAELASRAAERATVTATLAAAARAERVLPLIRIARDRTGRANTAAAAVRAALVPLDGLVADATDPEVLRKEERERRDELVALDQLRGEAAQLVDLDRRQRTLETDLRKAEQLDAALAATLAELPGRLDGLQRELIDARNAEAKLPGVEAAVDDLRRRLTAARRRDALTAELAMAEDDRRTAVDVAQTTKDRLQRLRQLRLDGMAAALAANLSAGEPCRVCGSTEHPAPAEPGDLPTVEDEEVAAEADEAAQVRREEAELTVATRRTELDAEIANAGDVEADVLHEELAETQERLTELGELAARTAELNERVGVVKNELEDAGLQRSAAGQLIAEAVTELRTLAELQEQLGAKLDKARGSDATLAARVDRIAGEAELFRVAAGALDAERTAVEELADARAAAGSAAGDEGFDGAAAAEDAVLAADRVAALTAELKAFDDEAAAVAGLLGDPELVGAAGQDEPELERLAADLGEADGYCSAVRSALDRARARRERFAELALEAVAAVAEWRPAAERHELVYRLAELVRGTSADNEARMKLSAYVLGARLGQVVAAANDRLGAMSDGRFALEHSDDKSAGDRSRSGGGLGLRIADSWTGVSRDPATLSGGESFITSLALALGLADVVTAEAGGAEIGVLFVDEGFGTLDEETLDEVMAVLDGLRDGGRAVGVVSHVAELRIRIPAQLRVHKDRHGSRVAVSA